MLDDVIARLESATEASRGLDRAIAYHLGVGVEKERRLYAQMGDAMWVENEKGLSPHDIARGDRIRSEWQKGTRRQRGGYVDVRWNCCDGPAPLTGCLKFSTSIDAAVTLVPDGFDWCVQSPGKYAQVWRGGAPHYEGNGATFALGICVAALKARLAEIRPEDQSGG